MNEKEAQHLTHDMYKHAHDDRIKCAKCEALGYLAALEGPEVAALRERWEKAEQQLRTLHLLAERLAEAIGEVGYYNDGCGCCGEGQSVDTDETCKTALAAWREYKGEK